jgi:hypothetical protein
MTHDVSPPAAQHDALQHLVALQHTPDSPDLHVELGMQSCKGGEGLVVKSGAPEVRSGYSVVGAAESGSSASSESGVVAGGPWAAAQN